MMDHKLETIFDKLAKLNFYGHNVSPCLVGGLENLEFGVGPAGGELLKSTLVEVEKIMEESGYTKKYSRIGEAWKCSETKVFLEIRKGPRNIRVLVTAPESRLYEMVRKRYEG